MDNKQQHINNKRDLGWERMQDLLDQQEEQPKVALWPKYSIAASILMILSAGVYFTTTLPQQKEYSSVAKPLKIKEHNFSKYYPSSSESLLSDVTKRSFSVPTESYIEVESETTSDLKNQIVEEIIVNNTQKTEEVTSTKKVISIVQQSKKETKVLASNSIPEGTKDVKETIKKEENIIDHDADGFSSNSTAQTEYKIVSSKDLPKAFQPKAINLGLVANGSVGLVSKNMEDFGLRFGFEVKKPVTEKLAINSGLRVSSYKEQYKSTYDVDPVNPNHHLIKNLSNRNVNRKFVELPIYADYKVHENISLKAGAALTYNTNKSETINSTTQNLATTTTFNKQIRTDATQMLGDKHGYLGEAVLGATLHLDRIALDVEGTYGFISNQTIENRSVVGVKLNYNFRK